MTSTIPIITRVAGLPADLDGIVLPPRHAAFELCAALEETTLSLASLRAAAVERLAGSVPGSSPEHRRQVLAWKRDCFNGRPLPAAAPEHPAWDNLGAESQEVLRRLLDLQERLVREAREFALCWRAERSEVRRRALELARGRDLQRGLCLASLGLVEGLARLSADGLEKQGRKERKAEASLVRYLSRAALKLSPYSTLTTLALARISTELPAPLKFFGKPEKSHSLVRVKRYLLDQSCDQLFLHRGLRRHLLVGLNPSLEQLSNGAYRFIKPHRLEMGEGDKLAYVTPAHVKVKLSGPLAPFVVDRLQGRRISLGALSEEIFGRFGGAELTPEQAELMAEELVRLGLVCLLTPWPGYHPQLEQNLLSFLHGLPPGAAPAEFERCLEELVWCEERFSETRDAAAAVRRIDDLATALYEAARFDQKSESAVALQKKANRNYYEDVFWSAPKAAGGELIGVRRDAIAAACEAGRLIWQLADVFEPRHEMLALMASIWGEKWPDRDAIAVPVFFAELKNVFEDYLAHLGKREGAPFDPLGLPAVAALGELRRTIRQGLERIVLFDGEVEVFALADLRELAELVPATLRPPLGPCLYLQPRDREASSWVVNRIFEGTGRMSSRFAAILPEPLRRDYLQHYVERSVVEHDGEPLELLDMLFTRANTVNAHWPQTRKVLIVPGESCDLEPARQVELRDLVVRRRAGGLSLADRRGGRYLPCFLSPLQTEFLPAILKFLDIFGCNVRARTSLSTRLVGRDGLLFQPRQEVGPLVVKRKRWILRRDAVPGLELPEAEAFGALNRWRLALGIPHQVYLVEAVQELAATPMFKPQYIDFRSPCFVSLFQSSLRLGGEEVTIDEALPRPEDFPLDAEGRPRGVELMIESLALREKGPVPLGFTPAMVAGSV